MNESPRPAPVHPSKRPPSDVPRQRVEETLALAQPGERYRLRVDFGAAYAALLGQKIRGRAPSMIVEVVLRVESSTRHGNTNDPTSGVVVLRGPVTWAVAGCASKVFRVPSELRCPHVPTSKFPVSLMIGNEGEFGGMLDGSWIIGQFGTVVSAERIDSEGHRHVKLEQHMRRKKIGDETHVTINADYMATLGHPRRSVAFRFSACGDLVDVWGSDSVSLMERAKKFAGF
jgi:hypothetical protein